MNKAKDTKVPLGPITVMVTQVEARSFAFHIYATDGEIFHSALTVRSLLTHEDAAKCILKDLWLATINASELWKAHEIEMPGSDGVVFKEMVRWALKYKEQVAQAVSYAGMMEFLEPWAREHGFYGEVI
jgi:hypothetical protein